MRGQVESLGRLPQSPGFRATQLPRPGPVRDLMSIRNSSATDSPAKSLSSITARAASRSTLGSGSPGEGRAGPFDGRPRRLTGEDADTGDAVSAAIGGSSANAAVDSVGTAATEVELREQMLLTGAGSLYRPPVASKQQPCCTR